MASKLEDLRSLVEGKRIRKESDFDEPGVSPAPPNELDAKELKKSAISYIGDVLDSMVQHRFISREEADSAAAVIANNAEEGPEAVVCALIAKGHIPGSRLLDGGHRKLRKHVASAMGEAMLMHAIGNAYLLTEANMTEKQSKFASQVETRIRDAIARVLEDYGYSPMNADKLVSSVHRRVRTMSRHLALEGFKRSVRPVVN